MYFEFFYKLFAPISAFSVLIPICSSLVRANEIKKNSVFKTLSIYLLVCFITEVVNAFHAIAGQSTALVGVVFYFLEFMLITQIYYYSFDKKKQISRFINIARILGCIFLL